MGANGHNMCSEQPDLMNDLLRQLRRRVVLDGDDMESTGGFLPMLGRRAASLPPAPEAAIRDRPREWLRWAGTKECACIAGLVALVGSGQSQYTCLVETRDGRIGFPKGLSLAGEKSSEETALRKWQEDVALPCWKLRVDAEMLADAEGCFYAVVECDSSVFDLNCKTWTVENSNEGPDADQVAVVHWMILEEANRNLLLIMAPQM